MSHFGEGSICVAGSAVKVMVCPTVAVPVEKENAGNGALHEQLPQESVAPQPSLTVPQRPLQVLGTHTGPDASTVMLTGVDSNGNPQLPVAVNVTAYVPALLYT